jgi:transcriptional regulator with GAF, ATPase, and Fis domain
MSGRQSSFATVDVLLTFTGFHDPFAETALEGDMPTGPVLTVVAERSFDLVYLFGTPSVDARTAETRDEIVRKWPNVQVEILEVPLKDPTNYLGILRQLRGHFKKLNLRHPDARYYIAVSSGTPQMHASWVLLAASGEIPATILQSTPPKFVQEGKGRVKEIDLLQPEFPRITRSLAAPQAEDEGELIHQACRELGIIGDDPAFLKALSTAHLYAQYGIHVLLLGETGSGKEYFTRFIHHSSKRSMRPLITVNCGSIPDNLVESQLFGHKKGAFTGATTNQEGKFKAADGGILFLDELGELPLHAQAKLLRALDQGEIEPVGATRPTKVDVQVVGATNRDLHTMVREGKVREDLYQRFGACIAVPPLRQRKADIAKLAVHMLDEWNSLHQRQRRLTPEALTALTHYHWPGNVRELEKTVTQSAMRCPGDVIGPQELQFDRYIARGAFTALPEPAEGFDLTAFLDETRERLVDRALEKAHGVQAQAARLLGWSPQAMNQHLKSRQIQRK